MDKKNSLFIKKSINNKNTGKDKIMKIIRRILAVLFSVTMLIGTGITTFATGSTGYTIAVKNETEGYTYKAYQIFTGDLSEGVLSNIGWGNGITSNGKDALYQKYGLTNDTDKTAAKVAEIIAEHNNAAEADDIATLLAKTTGNLDNSEEIAMSYSNSITIGTGSGAETFKGYAATNQAAGWYLIVNTDVPSSVEDATYSDYIVEVVGDVKAEPKSGKPGSEKHVDDKNDSDPNNHSELKDSADYDIGDHVPYTLTATLPSDYANYKTYYIQFQDDMSSGLTLDTDTVKIFYGSSDTEGTSIAFSQSNTPTSAYTSGKVYTYTIEDLKATASSLVAGDVIKITYTATLNSNAVIGSAGNPNQYRIEFSNNPNGDSKGNTPWDKNIVFTYKTVFNKVDEAGKPLTGADFTLEKFILNSLM